MLDYNTFLFMQIFLWHNKRWKNDKINLFSRLKIIKGLTLNNYYFILWNISAESHVMFFGRKRAREQIFIRLRNAKPAQTCLGNELIVQVIVLWMTHTPNLVCWPSSKKGNYFLLTCYSPAGFLARCSFCYILFQNIVNDAVFTMIFFPPFVLNH